VLPLCTFSLTNYHSILPIFAADSPKPFYPICYPILVPFLSGYHTLFHSTAYWWTSIILLLVISVLIFPAPVSFNTVSCHLMHLTGINKKCFPGSHPHPNKQPRIDCNTIIFSLNTLERNKWGKKSANTRGAEWISMMLTFLTPVCVSRWMGHFSLSASPPAVFLLFQYKLICLDVYQSDPPSPSPVYLLSGSSLH